MNMISLGKTNTPMHPTKHLRINLITILSFCSLTITANTNANKLTPKEKLNFLITTTLPQHVEHQKKLQIQANYYTLTPSERSTLNKISNKKAKRILKKIEKVEPNLAINVDTNEKLVAFSEALKKVKNKTAFLKKNALPKITFRRTKTQRSYVTEETTIRKIHKPILGEVRKIIESTDAKSLSNKLLLIAVLDQKEGQELNIGLTKEDQTFLDEAITNQVRKIKINEVINTLNSQLKGKTLCGLKRIERRRVLSVEYFPKEPEAIALIPITNNKTTL